MKNQIGIIRNSVDKQYRWYSFDIVDSTNDEAKKLVTEENPIVVVTANYQQKGRGRRGSQWQGEYGKNLYCSIAWKTLPTTWTPQSAQEASALTVYEVLKELFAETNNTDLDIAIKYPNDIYARNTSTELEGKICGILIESEYKANTLGTTVVGIGMNILQDIFEDVQKTDYKPISLKQLTNIVEYPHIVEKLVDKFMWKTTKSALEIHEEWKKYLFLENKDVRVINSRKNSMYIATIQTIELDGRLRIKIEKETRFLEHDESIIYNMFDKIIS